MIDRFPELDEPLVASLNRALVRTVVSVDEEAELLRIAGTDLSYALTHGGTLLNPASAHRLLRSSEWEPRLGVALFEHSTSRGRTILQDRGWAYLTAEGHLFLDDRERSVYLYIERASKPGRVAAQPGAYTATDLKMVFAYLTLAPSGFGGAQTELAAYANVSEASVTRALRKLGGNGFPRERDRLLPEQLLALMQTWAEQYHLTLKPKLRTKRFHPVSWPEDWRYLPELPVGLTYTGIAAAAVDGFDLVAGRELEVYADFETLQTNARLLRWAPSSEGMLVCRERFWGQPAIDWCLTGRSAHITIPLLTYADLLAMGNPRAIEAAERDVLKLCLQLYRR